MMSMKSMWSMRVVTSRSLLALHILRRRAKGFTPLPQAPSSKARLVSSALGERRVRDTLDNASAGVDTDSALHAEGTDVQYQQLGHTDLIVSRICFGCWQLSPRFWGKVPLKEWREAVNAAADLGVNFIDTAGAYGDGYAETCLGNHLSRARLRDRFVIATKFYWNFRGPERHPDTSHDFILQECEDSLRRLKTDRIDLRNPR